MTKIEWTGDARWMFGLGEINDDSPTEIKVDGETIKVGEGNITFTER